MISTTRPTPAAAHAAIAPVTASGRSVRDGSGLVVLDWRVPVAELVITHQPGNCLGRRRGGAPGRLNPAARRATQPRRRAGQRARMTSRTRPAVPLGVRPTRTPTFSSASFLACAVPADPEMIAPA